MLLFCPKDFGAIMTSSGGALDPPGRLLKYWNGSRVEAEGRMARSEEGASPERAATTERRRQLRMLSGPAALLPRAVDGCVDFGAGRRCSLGRDRCGYRGCASRLGQRQNPQQREPLQYFKSLLRKSGARQQSQRNQIAQQTDNESDVPAPSNVFQSAVSY